MKHLTAAIFPERIRQKVVHLKRDDYDVRVDRQTEWGNPCRLEDYDGRLACLRAYLMWLRARPHSKYDPQYQPPYDQKRVIEEVDRLEGQTLGCWCSPQLCHGHVLAAMAAADDPREAIDWIVGRINKVRTRTERSEGEHPDPHAQLDPKTLKAHPGNKF